MIELILISVVSFVLILGDIAWDYLSEALWYIGLHTQGTLNFMKKRRPDRTHWNYQ